MAALSSSINSDNRDVDELDRQPPDLKVQTPDPKAIESNVCQGHSPVSSPTPPAVQVQELAASGRNNRHSPRTNASTVPDPKLRVIKP
ncbi:hypothetical protein E2562_022244 [Oryza meyeriana var. granulata]|uniref:Uncharacterized protein n=1 Tax=Oryza meyeriana var. granulata TaxID=110450 RepID=A0A6G1ENX8_9ORYZ|nr:hypothetical protein E2562_022244 [Oryza meyeriana var. granulata]